MASTLKVLALSAAVLFGGAMGQEANVSPIRKVVMLIEEMKVQTEKDAKADLESYDKYMCWCKTNEAAKTTAIADAEATIEELTAFVEESKAKEGQLKTEIGQLQTDIAEDTDALATATATREKENDEFKATETDLTETIGLLKESVEILSKVQLLQKNGEAPSKELLEQAHRTTEILMQVKAKHVASRPSFAGLMQKDLFDMLGALGGPKDSFLPRRKMALNQASAMQPEISEEEAGMAARPNGQNGAAAGAKSYNSRSGKIFGLLSEMSEEMQRDLAEATKTEAQSNENFANLKAAKEAEIAAATEQEKAKTAELADTLNKMAKAKRDLEKTEAALAADTEFLANMKKDCQVEDENYKKRAEIRSQEIVALAETLKILNEDDARTLFGKSVGTSFIQESSEQKAMLMNAAQKKAMQRIAEVARKHKNWALASLAVRVRLDAFTKIKEMMDKMLVELKKQQAEEYEKAEACKKDIDETEDTIKEKNNLKDDLDEKHKSLKNSLETLATEIAELQKEEEDMKIALKQAGEQRKAENQIFQQSVMDQRATVNILNKALARLKSFYSSSFIQQPGQAVSAPPPKGKDYSKSGGAGGVLQLLQQIITEAEQEEIELSGDEQNAQKNYGEFVQDTTASIEADRKAIEEKTAQTAEAETALSETEEAQMANNAEISKLDDLLKAIHVGCDFTLKYFDIRQQARQEEMDSITDAKAILSGAQ
jgi:hypothetical protein